MLSTYQQKSPEKATSISVTLKLLQCVWCINMKIFIENIHSNIYWKYSFKYLLKIFIQIFIENIHSNIYWKYSFKYLLKIFMKLFIENIYQTYFNLTLYGPNSFFRRFSGHNLR